MVIVNRRENATLRITLTESSYNAKHRNDDFLWVKQGGNGEHADNIQMKVTMRAERNYVYYIFKITILESDISDNGTYLMQNSYQNPCTILRINVIVRNTPSCTSLLISNTLHIKLACTWMPWRSNDRMHLTAGNREFQYYSYPYQNNNLNSGVWTRTPKVFWNSTVISGVTMGIHDAFDENHIPDTCVAFDSQIESEQLCRFSVFMLPEVNQINESGEVTFTCCTNTDYVPSLWWYTSITKITKALGQNFTIYLEGSTQDSGYDNISDIFFICGEGNEDELAAFRIGKLVLSFQSHMSILLSGRIEEGRLGSEVPTSEEICTHPYIITVHANPHGMDYSTSTHEMVLHTKTITHSTHDFSLSSSRVSIRLEIMILFIAFFAISFFANIGVSIGICRKFIVLKKNPPVDGNTCQANIRSDSINGEGTIQMTSVSSVVPPSAEQRSYSPQTGVATTGHGECFSRSHTKKHGFKPSGMFDEHQEQCMKANILKCRENSTTIRHQFFGNGDTGLAHEAGENCKGNISGQYEFLGKEESTLYQNFNGGEDTENLFSSEGAEQCIEDDVININSAKFVKHHISLPDSSAKEDDYANCDTNQENKECPYAVPDKPPNSKTIAVGEGHSGGSTASSPSLTTASDVSAPSDSAYACLRRPEIERHVV